MRMPYYLSIVDGMALDENYVSRTEIRHTKVWKNFCTNTFANSDNITRVSAIRMALEKYNAKVINYYCIRFDTQEDAMSFILRWS